MALVAFLHDNRGYMSNEQRLKTARSLLRLTWSLTYSTISDFLDSLKEMIKQCLGLKYYYESFLVTEIVLNTQSYKNEIF